MNITTFIVCQNLWIQTPIMANFTARLEPFILISKSAKGAAAAKLIQDATSAPGVFIFAELLELPNIQEARPVVASHFFSSTYIA